MKSRILLVAQSDSQRELTATALRTYGCEVYEAWSTESARHLLSWVKARIVILDLAGEVESGVVLVGEISLTTGAIVVSSDPSADTRLAFLEAGALDYILKPIDPRDLALKVRNIVSFARGEAEPMTNFDLGPLRVDLVSRVLTSSVDGSECRLTDSELALLRIFLQSQGSVLSRRDLTNLMNYSEDAINGRKLDVLVCRLRSKLKRIDQAWRLVSIHRKGYSVLVEDLAIPPQLLSDPSLTLSERPE